MRRERYEEVDPRFGHDLSFPYLMVKRGFRAVYAPRAVALEKMTTDLEDEFRRKVRMFGHCWVLVLHGRMFSLRALGPLYWVEMVSHRLLRYASGLLHLALLATSLVLAFSRRRRVRRRARRCTSLFALCVLASIALRGRVRVLALAEYYLLVTAGHAARAGRRRARRARRSGSARRARGERRGRARQARASTSSAPRRAWRWRRPILALAACAIKLEDGGPVLFRQVRLGRGGGALRDPQAAHDDRRRREPCAATAWSRPSDPRITRIGALLRRTAVDELPQLWHVLRGDMSLVGPRPVPPPHLERYDERQRRRLEVRPGLTGWAQIHGRASLPWPERSSSTSGTSSTARWRSMRSILARTAGVLLRRDVVYRGEAGGWR